MRIWLGLSFELNDLKENVCPDLCVSVLLFEDIYQRVLSNFLCTN